VPPTEAIEFNHTANPYNPTRAVLSIGNVSAKMVGMYYCVKKQSYYDNRHLTLDRLVKMHQASMIYIYVNDPAHPLVPIDGIVFKVYRGDFFVSPCKPTLPNVDVELYITNEGDGTQDFITNCNFSVHGCLLRFDKLEDSGSYFCKAKGKFAKYLMKPSIESDIKGSVPFGELIHLECKVNITAGVDLSMKWVIPQNKTLMKTIESNIRSGPLKVVPTKDAELMYAMSGELIIQKAIQANIGSYWCIVEDQIGNKNSRSFELYVHEPPEDYVMLREENNLSVINVRRNAYGFTSPIDIVFEYRSYPEIITYYWLNDSDQKIMAGYKNKYKLSHTDTHVKLRINGPKVFDTGIYTVFVTAGKATQSRRMEVYVHAKPIVQMQSKFVKTGEQVSFLCRSIGFPRPEIFFMFQPCSNKPKWTNCSSQAPAASGWDSARGKDETKIANSQVLVHTAKVPGVVYCTATNSEGSKVTQADLLVSDLPDAITMEIEHPKETITVGDNVTVVCSALVYNYTNDITFARNGIDMTGVWTKYSKELYAEQARFNIESIQHEDGGMYSCQVKTIYDTYETRYLHLQVLDPVKPILKSGKSNETLVVELTSPLRLECDVIGTPDPKIIWLKDGIPVVPEEGSNRVQLNRTTFIFEYLREKESGMYECHAENKIGRIEKYWNVDVRTTVVRKSLIYAIIALLLLLIVAIVLVSLFYCKKKKEVKAMKEAGIVNFEEGELMVIVEYCRFGNVQSFLLKHRPYFIDQINQETGEIDSSIDKNQLRWSKCGYQYNSKHNQPEPEYMNVKNHKFTGRAPNEEPAGGTQEAISNPGYIALSMVDEKRLSLSLTETFTNFDENSPEIDTKEEYIMLAKDYVLLREKNNRSEINVHRNANSEVSPIDIVFEYQSYPASIMVLWTIFSGATTVGRSRKYAVSRTDTQAGLRINEPSVYDTSNYTLRLYIDLNNPYLTMNIQKQRNGNVDYLAGQGPPEEYAPAVPDIHKI
uniref:Ig-like domain-containing protein n=1 Tax=Anopheles dirus TaxID=7168 RepID=A0A182NT43_9DIPT